MGNDLIFRREAIMAVRQIPEYIWESAAPHGASFRRSAVEFAINSVSSFLPEPGLILNAWIPCSERLPSTSGRYLCNTRRYRKERPISRNRFMILYFDRLWVSPWEGEGEDGMRVTHWMPLPEAPVEGENRDAEANARDQISDF